MTLRNRSSLLFATLTLALAGGCGSETDSPSQPVDDQAAVEAATNGPMVSVTNNEFMPVTIDIDAGDTVTWMWDQGTHNVMFDDVGSENQSDGTWSRTLDEPGVYDYSCTLHRGMTGTVVVS